MMEDKQECGRKPKANAVSHRTISENEKGYAALRELDGWYG